MAKSSCKLAHRLFGKKNAVLLQAICAASPQQRRALINRADLKLVRCICECALNILKGNVPLKPSEKKRLSKHKTFLRKLAKIGKSLKTKKKIINQKGGSLLPLILGPVVSALISKIF